MLMERSGDCPECGSTEFVQSGGEYFCGDCGLVVGDSGPSSSAAEALVEAGVRSGERSAPVTFTRHDKGVSSDVGMGRAELHKVARRKRGQYSRLLEWQGRLTGSRERNLGRAFTELRRTCSVLGLPDPVAEESARLYEKAVESDLVKGRSLEAVVLALIYAVARKQGAPRTLEEVAEVSDLDSKEIGSTYRYLSRELDLDVSPADPEDYIPRFADRLDLSAETRAKAREIVDRARRNNLLVGRRRTGIAAAALYMAGLLKGEKRTQVEVAEAAGVTVPTVRTRYQEILDSAGPDRV